ncbi:3-methylornithyl-N6-L-lysine dehydrogenase PylD [Eubacteriaceae bacterium ES2]|nr:3-methylornithyl-N6-L-lysine dehydrogenase PylD [Eubacteriaceae bacterium ES2]
MTRLKPCDINDISANIASYDLALKKTMRYTLAEIARHAVALPVNYRPDRQLKIAVVPVTSGLGIISGFCQTVCAILKHCCLNASVAEASDIEGLQEAYRSGADMVFIADDKTCSAFSLDHKVYSDNGYATGIAFSAALELMMPRVVNEKVLVLGAGPVGSAAVNYFVSKKIATFLYDTDLTKMHSMAAKIPAVKLESGPLDLKKYNYILDATSGHSFIGRNDVNPGTKISAPGMPLSLKPEAFDQVELFHNPLELGILTMYFHCIKQMEVLHEQYQ